MHKLKLFILSTLFVLAGGGVLLAGTQTSQHCQRITFSAASTPVAILPAVQNEASMLINEEAADTVNVLAFPYAGPTVPAAVPSACGSPTASLNDSKGCVEITPNKPFSDAAVCDAPNCAIGGDAWAAVVETAGTVTLDTCYRYGMTP